MPSKAMIILIDGASAAYLNATNAPQINRLAQVNAGFLKTVAGQFPTVTNVNHARILTGAFPAENGINGNGFFNRQTGEQTFIESPAYLNAPTIFTRLAHAQRSSALLTVKGKIDQVFGQNATYRINAERPDEELLKKISAPLPPDISSLNSGGWVVQTAKRLIAAKSPDFVYATTNDYVMHHFGPDTPEAQAFIRQIDDQVAAIHALEPERTIYVTADHGMNFKPTLLNLELLLKSHGLAAHILLPLADRYLKNHQYQESGSAYVYAATSDLPAIQRLLTATPGVAAVLTNDEAAQRFQLDPTRIGDLVVLATEDVAFGLQPQTTLTNYPGRSHGSLAELTVPLLRIATSGADTAAFQTSRDLFDQLQTALDF
ncbi:phosphodiesterase [Lactiplantibacillus garii]|uniref:Phosphodiesterase n=1 Tax=Lactiplantibacillus garii TaxID=2306423 RepID=A0A3R8KDU1_9LACO|nr:nucleotide pyrophosphatase/phosphodiesterase family protein [Lactiplantibacillus garii]RRK09964.1 phosphodiesterase [Lactiplantibacillus garii]